jgi:hypothetical protein
MISYMPGSTVDLNTLNCRVLDQDFRISELTEDYKNGEAIPAKGNT